ncbi:unnamed protein product [Lepidochelys kempii]
MHRPDLHSMKPNRTVLRWQRQLYIHFIDFEKAFDSIHRTSLWHILRAHGIPFHIINVIKSFYFNITCSVDHRELSFEVKTGIRQGCVMSAILFSVAIDWVMWRTTEDMPRGIKWTLFSSLEDLDFADDVALLSHTQHHIQEKTTQINAFSQQIGLKIKCNKTDLMIFNIASPSPVGIEDYGLTSAETFTYLGSTISQDGGTSQNIQNKICKARNTFRSLNTVWKSSKYTTKTKLKIYQSCVLSTLL